MKNKRLIALFAVAGLVAPGAAVLATPTVAYAAAYPTLSYGAQSSAVKQLQSKLQAEGYSVGTIDGIFGPRTLATVKKFQSIHHLSVDGIVGPITWHALNSAVSGSPDTVASTHPTGTPVVTTPIVKAASSSPLVGNLPTKQIVRYGSQGSAVKVVQTALNSLGYHCGTVDGIYGPETYAAIRAFQKANHLQTDGIVGPETWGAFTTALRLKTSSSTAAPKPVSSPTSSTAPASGTAPSSGTAPASGSTVSKPTTTGAISYPGTLVRYGSRGPVVKEIQQRLNQLGYNCGVADGVYGPNTYAAIRKFQNAHHLTVDGIIGPQTWPILFSRPDSSGGSGTSSASSSTGRTSSRGTDPLVSYTAFNSQKQKIGTYSSETAAQSALANSPGGYVTNADGTVLWRQSDYIIYNSTGEKIGESASLSQAEGQLATVPLGTVRNASENNQVVYTQPDVYAAYTSPDGNPMDTTSLQTAQNDIQGSTVGFVIDLGKESLAVQPSDYFYLDSSHRWIHHVYGVEVNTGSTVPSWAATGGIYVAKPANTPPYYYDYYQIAGVSSPVHAGTFENPYRMADLRMDAPGSVNATTINNWYYSVNSPLNGLGSAFLQAQADFGVNAVYLAAHALQETGNTADWQTSPTYGQPIPVAKNNLFGYGAFTASPNSAALFPSESYAVEFEAWYVKQFYLNQGAPYYFNWPTLDGMNRYYATDPNWSSDIAMYMDELAASSGASPTDFPQYQSTNTPSNSQSSDEPLYQFPSGALGTVISGNGAATVKAYSAYEMRPTLTMGDSGYWVQMMQQALNASGMSNSVTVDGDFGTVTLNALKSFQSAEHISVDGVCGPETWSALELASGETHPVALASNTKVNVLAERMDFLTNWYYVSEVANPQLAGWVPAASISLSNVYRVVPSTSPSRSGYDVTLADGTVLRGGDDVVSADGKTSVTYAVSEQYIQGSSVAAAPSQTSTLQSGSLEKISN